MSRLIWTQKHAWQALWIALLRSPKDNQARKNLFRLLLSLFSLLAFLAYYFFLFRYFGRNEGIAGVWFLLGCICFSLLLTAVIAFKQRIENRSTEKESPAVDFRLKIYLYREAALIALLLQRAGSEVAMEKILPEGIKVITRRVLLDRMNNLGLREDLDPWALELLLAPDGHWTPEQKQKVNTVWELFSILDWTLGLKDLGSLSSNPNYQFTDLEALFKISQPEKLPVLPSWDLRPARDFAERFFSRCWTEMIARGMISKASPENLELASNARNEIRQLDYTRDYLVGTKTIAEIDSDLLRLVSRRAFWRLETLSLLVGILSGDIPPRQLRQYISHFFAPVEEPMNPASHTDTNLPPDPHPTDAQ